ncbi:hypothetical protein ACQE98_11255 [Ornithinimicrobium sp. W1679]|uniref:hypothetical protein n=1 Tax=unclassified Ornithinimicrobium TaxID=2615080 RepID=UPI003CEF9AC5
MTGEPDRPTTGDDVVDQALVELDARLDGGADPLEAVVEAHRVLQQRLTAPPAPPAPGQARPGRPG